MPSISQEANDLIVASEVGSRAQYEKKYRHPEWPGGASGVTVGVGYDIGYATETKVRKDWGTLLPPSMVQAMVSCCGITGEAAQAKTAQVKNVIDVPWDVAVQVYERTDIPEWIKRVCDAIPGAAVLHPHCLGALTSLAYNRGASFKMSGDRYKEMRDVRAHIMSGQLNKVDDDIRAMKHLWPASLSGLWVRRDKEAALWNKGLAAVPGVGGVTPVTAVSSEPSPLAPAKPAGAPEAATSGGGLATAAATAKQASEAGISWSKIAFMVLAVLVVTGLTVWLVRYKRSQPVIARVKG